MFCSKKDWVALGFVVRVVGTTDNFWSGAAAGRLGFKPKKGPTPWRTWRWPGYGNTSGRPRSPGPGTPAATTACSPQASFGLI